MARSSRWWKDPATVRISYAIWWSMRCRRNHTRIVHMAKFLVCAVLAVTALAQTKTPDLCVPPPSGTAPALPAHIMTGMGKVHLAITTSNPRAQEFFDQGLAQLHSFWATEAERSFRQAAALDPVAPMPWWGVAMISAGDYRPRFQIEGLAISYGTDSRTNPSRAKAAAERAVAL